MNKVVTIHLNGTAYQLEEAGYEALRAYLDGAARQLANNPDKDEIIADIEQAIGEKCRGLLGGYRTVILTKDIERIIAEMGPVDDGSAAADRADANTSSSHTAAGSPPPASSGAGGVKRIYRIHEGAMISGVCNGFAAYFGIDPTILRAALLILALLSLFISFFAFLAVVLAYFALVILLPSARTDAEKAAAQGIPATAQEFIRRARAGYYEATKTFGDKEAHRAWKRKFRQEMRGWRRNFQQEMNAHAQQWQANWGSQWAQHPGAQSGLWFTIGFLSLLGGALTLVWLFALVSLVMKHSVFGLALPATMPLWVGIVIVCVIYAVMMSPIRGARHAFTRHGWGGPACGGGFFGVFEPLLGFAFLALGIWVVDRYVPGAHEVLVKIPPALHQAFDAFKAWWNTL